jgi:hypothetical protein
LLSYNLWVPSSNPSFKLNVLELLINYDNFSMYEFFNVFDFIFLGFHAILFSLNTVSILSSVDLIFELIFENLWKQGNSEISLSFFLDHFFKQSVHFTNLYFNNIWLYYDSHLLFYLNSPEYVFYMSEFLDSVNTNKYSNIKILYDTLNFTFIGNILEYSEFLVWSLTLVFLLTAVFSTFRLSNFSFLGNSLLNRVYFFLWSFSVEQRINFTFTFTWFTFFLFLWAPILMTYDDQNIEFIELMHFLIILTFLVLILTLLYKYSIHYFSFLENSIADGFSVQFILKQFVRDIANSFALFLRFFLLVFRLNIYDGLDDFLDSYYIFFIDFDEDNYFDESLFFSDKFIFLSDNHEDILQKSTTEYSWWIDLYSKYFIILTKFLFFWVFILEEFFRIALALYISYLIIFEIHSVNTSYNETKFQKCN